MRKIAELIRIENEYWGSRDQGLIPEIPDDAVPPYPKANGESGSSRPPAIIRPLGIARFAGGRFRFGK